jgi:hypothetical protein
MAFSQRNLLESGHLGGPEDGRVALKYILKRWVLKFEI